MNKITLLIITFALFLASSASAETNRGMCEARYPGETSTARLQQVICVQALDINDLQNKIAAGEQGQEKRMKELTEALKATQEELTFMQRNGDRSSQASSSVTATGSTDAQQSANAALLAAIQARMAGGKTETKPQASVPIEKYQPARPTPQPGVIIPKMLVGGAPFMIEDAPGQNVATTFDISGPRLEMAYLGRGAHKWMRSVEDVRIVVRKNGTYLPIAHDDPTRPWNEIYAAIDNKTSYDRKPYKAVDPRQIDNIYIPLVGPKDKIELIFLSDTGKRVRVPGYPDQILWGDGVRVLYDRVRIKGTVQLWSQGGSQRMF